MSAPEPTDQPLAGRRFLVVEDEFILATALADLLRAKGAMVTGPVTNLKDASEAVADSTNLDGALLDINLRGTNSFDLIERLTAMGVPCVFVTGVDRSRIPDRFAHVPCVQKPMGSAEVINALCDLAP